MVLRKLKRAKRGVSVPEVGQTSPWQMLYTEKGILEDASKEYDHRHAARRGQLSVVRVDGWGEGQYRRSDCQLVLLRFLAHVSSSTSFRRFCANLSRLIYSSTLAYLVDANPVSLRLRVSSEVRI